MNNNIDEWKLSVQKNERFQFGNNWVNYLDKLNTEDIEMAKFSMYKFLDEEELKNSTFLDIGSGSGLHSLVASMAGAKVYSFDFDLDSYNATLSLKEKYLPLNENWVVNQGSILDSLFLKNLPKFNIVYSWGVLHHTGEMWNSINNAIELVDNKGYFFIAIYNNQGWKSKFWWHVKFIYNKLPKLTKKPFAIFLGIIFNLINIIKYTILLKPYTAIKPLLNYKHGRGMKISNDIIDWIGGFPYEYATLNKLNIYFNLKGFEIVKFKEANSLGCHEILYKKVI